MTGKTGCPWQDLPWVTLAGMATCEQWEISSCQPMQHCISVVYTALLNRSFCSLNNVILCALFLCHLMFYLSMPKYKVSLGCVLKQERVVYQMLIIIIKLFKLLQTDLIIRQRVQEFQEWFYHNWSLQYPRMYAQNYCLCQYA